MADVADDFGLGLEWRPIARQARLVWTLAGLAIAVPVLVLLVVGAAAAAGAAGLAVSVVVSAGVIALVRALVVRRHRSWGYGVRDDELVLRRGVLVRRLTIVPIGRMQFVDIQQGPLDRRFGVANLQLHTAAAATDAKIPMLSLDDAGALRRELMRRGAERSAGV